MPAHSSLSLTTDELAASKSAVVADDTAVTIGICVSQFG